jgi:hypothetical protein
MPHGDFRRVILIGRIALKFPRLRNLTKGLRCNRWEREMWRTWRPVFGWKNLCPVIFADPLGLVVVMPRAMQPVTADEVDAETPDSYPDTTSETKPDDFGRVEGRLLALDYGLPYADMVAERRAYYRGKAPHHGQRAHNNDA